MSFVVNFLDNSGKVRAEFLSKVQLTLALIGETAEGYAKEDCPVDTGRLRNSITYITSTKQSPANTNPPRNTKSKPQAASTADVAPRGKPEENCVYIGTNVEYAPKIEYNEMRHTSGRAHFLRDAATTHNEEYKNIAETVLKA